jgi:hypothetical protein
MSYGPFHDAYESVQADVSAGRLASDDLKTEILKLEGLANAIDDPVARWEASARLRQLQDLVVLADTLPAQQVSQAQLEAMTIAQEAKAPSGSAARRIRRLRDGKAQIHEVAARVDDPSERGVIAQHAEELESLASALEHPEPTIER